LHYELVEQRFSGRIRRVETNYAFIVRDGFGDLIFLHTSNVPFGLWREIAEGDGIAFSLAFTFRGASAFDIELINVEGAAPAQLNLLLPATNDGRV
jgi:cold shock CspA family protein